MRVFGHAPQRVDIFSNCTSESAALHACGIQRVVVGCFRCVPDHRFVQQIDSSSRSIGWKSSSIDSPGPTNRIACRLARATYDALRTSAVWKAAPQRLLSAGVARVVVASVATIAVPGWHFACTAVGRRRQSLRTIRAGASSFCLRPA
jgi:hypothetical protein